MLHYLRSAVTALSLTACVLLIVLWVRSYWWCDLLFRGTMTLGETRIDTIESESGTLCISRFKMDFSSPNLFPYVTDGKWEHRAQIPSPNPDTFEWTWTGEKITIRAPTWLPLTMPVIVAAATCAGSQFSLRTLLIATTLVAVVLELLVLFIPTH